MTINKLIVLAASLAAMRVAAQPTVVSLPLELEPNAELMKSELKLRSAVANTVEAESGALVALKRETETALTETKRQDFRESDEALAQLALKAKSLYALHTWVDITTKRIMVLHGRVVRDDGKLMVSAEVEKPMKKDKPDTLIKPLTKELLAKLNLGALPAQKEVVQPPPLETPPVVKKDPPPDFVPPPPPPLVELKDEGAGQRAGGQGLFAAGLAIGAVGGVVAAVGGAVGSGVPRNAAGDTTVDGSKTLGTARGLTTAGFVGMGIGAAAALVGGIVWATAKPPPVKVSAMPTSGGAFVHLEGEF